MSDYDYLSERESNEYYYRLRGVKLCESSAGDLLGIQAYVGKYSMVDNSLLSTLGMNKIGTVTGSRCSTLLVDPQQGEYIKKFSMRLGPNSVDAVSVSASSGTILYKGLGTRDMPETV